MEKSVVETLPPCRVCGAPATGLHYGVISCEACKAFYRRSLARGDVYECPEDRSCKISSESRNNCAYCRYQKCLQAGMSKDAIKTGRHSYAMKASTIREVKGLKSDAANNSKSKEEICLEKSNQLQSLQHYTTKSTIASDFMVEIGVTGISGLGTPATVEPHLAINKSSNVIQYNNIEPHRSIGDNNFISEAHKTLSNCSGTDDETISVDSDSRYSCLEELMLNSLSVSDQHSEYKVCNRCKEIMTDSVGLCLQCNLNSVSWDYVKKNNTSVGAGNEIENSSHNCLTAACSQSLTEHNVGGSIYIGPENKQKLYDISKIEIYDQVIERLLEKHKAMVPEDIRIDSALSEKEREYLELVELKKRIFGPLEPMSAEEYFNFYQATGLDIDGRREMLLEFLPLAELNIRQLIDFVKSIPGFRGLSLNDQIGLIKGSRLDFSMFACHRCYNIEHNLYSPFVGKVYHLDEFKKFEGEHFETAYAMLLKVKKLDLSSEETVVLCAYTVMVTDNCELEDPTTVEHCQDFLLECLFYLFDKQRPPGERGRFIRIVECLVEIRNLREVSNELDAEFFNMWRNDIHIPPLLCEMISAK